MDCIDRLSNELQKFNRYKMGACRNVSVEGFQNMTYMNGAFLLAAKSDDALQAIGYSAMAYCIGGRDKAFTPQGESLNATHLCKRAIIYDPSCAMAYDVLYRVMGGAHALNGHGPFELPDGRTLSLFELCLEPLHHNPRYTPAFKNLITFLDVHGDDSEDGPNTVQLPDGRRLQRRDLEIEALRCDPYDIDLCLAIARSMAPGTTVELEQGRPLHQHELLLDGVARCLQTIGDGPRLAAVRARFYSALRDSMPSEVAWSRRTHPLVFQGETNVLFATLLLGRQRLETAGTLTPAHHSMLEDLLEGWSWADAQAVMGVD